MPRGDELAFGEIRIETRAGAITSKLADPLMDPKVAVTVAVPMVRAVARPFASIEAKLPGDVQVTNCVRSWALPLLSMPVAGSCVVVLTGMSESAAVTLMETRIGVTVRLVDPVMPLRVARMLAVPLDTPVASPAPLTVATPVAAEDHVTCPVMSGWVPSLYVPVAVNC
jgi:hypothetical protein